MEVSAHPTRKSALMPLMPLMLALAACSDGGGGSPAKNATPPPSQLFVLGDSLSDVGNAAAAADYVLNVPIDPPTVGLCNPIEVLALQRRCDDLFYRQSRVSDGPLAVEHLAQRFGLPTLRPSLHLLPNQPRDGTVYAVTGAKAGGVADEALARQVDWLLIDHTPLPADALYVIMIGGNDAIEALKADVASPATAAKPSAAIVSAAVDAIATQAERLLAFGARRVLVANVPDLAAVPAVRIAARASGDEAAALAAANAISTAFNRELEAALDEIEAAAQVLAPTPVIVRFDLYAALSVAQLAVAANGGNAVDACFATDVYRDSSAARRVFHADCAPVTLDGAPRFAQFAFFDGIHPTGAAHAVIGEVLGTLF